MLLIFYQLFCCIVAGRKWCSLGGNWCDSHGEKCRKSRPIIFWIAQSFGSRFIWKGMTGTLLSVLRCLVWV